MLAEEELSAIRELVKEWGSSCVHPHGKQRHRERSERVSERALGVLLKRETQSPQRLPRRKLLALIAADVDIQMSTLAIVAVGATVAKYFCS